MARAYWHAEQVAEVSTTDEVNWTTAVALSATLPANGRYAVLWSGFARRSEVSHYTETRLWDGSVMRGRCMTSETGTLTTDRWPVGGMYFITTGGAPLSITLTVDCRSADPVGLGGPDKTARLRECVIVVLALEDADAFGSFVDAGTPVTLSNGNTYTQTISVSVLQAGEYLVLATCSGGGVTSTTGTARSLFDLIVDGSRPYASSEVVGGFFVHDRRPCIRGLRVDLAAGDHTIGAFVGTPISSNTTTFEFVELLAIRLDDEAPHYYAQAAIDAAKTNTLNDDVVSLAFRPEAGLHLVIAGAQVNVSSGSEAFSTPLMLDDAVAFGARGPNTPALRCYPLDLTAGAHTFEWQRTVPVLTSRADGFICVIPLFDALPAPVVDPDIPVSNDSMYVVDLTVAPVDLSPTLQPALSPAIGVGAIGVGAVAAPVPAGVLPVYDDPVEEVRHFADVDWTTIPADGAAVFHDGRADQPIEFERTVPLAPSAPRNTFGIGRMQLLNADQGLRDLALDYSIDGRAVEILVGSPRASRATFQRLFRGVADFWGSATATQLTVELRDRWRKLTTDPRPLFRGTGGGDGPPELRDKPVPLWLGWRSNVPLVFLTNDPFPIYIASGYPMNSIAYVRSRAHDIPIQGTTTDIFAASTPTLGQCLVCPHNLADGRAYVGFASQPAGAVTAGGRGATVGGVGGAYLARMADIARWLLSNLGGIAGEDIDAAAWTALRARWTGEVGAWFGTDPATVLDMMAGIMHAATWWGDDTEGRVTCGTLDTPDRLGTPSGTLSSDEIIEIERVDWPGGAPWRRVQVEYDTNDFVQSTDVAEATPEWLAYIREAGRVYGADNIPVRTAHAGAIDPDPVRTPFRIIYDAAEVQQIVAHLNSGAVDLWRVVTADDRVRFPIGHVLTLDDDQVASVGVPALVVGTAFSAGDARATYLLVA